MTPVSIGITTRDRRESLRACLQSISRVLGAAHEILVFDDGSRVPVVEQLNAGELRGVHVLRDDTSPGPIVGRNRLVDASQHPFVLLLDDDVLILEAEALEMALEVLREDAAVAAVAFAQADAQGQPWPAGMQAGPATVASRVPAFIGFAHLLRRIAFAEVGGYREALVFYGEEKELCRRLLAAGYSVVYLPLARVAHIQDPSGRDRRRHLRYLTRNDCLTTLFNDPAPIVVLTIPVVLWRYRRAAARLPNRDAGGFRWLLREVREAWPAIARGRRPVRWRVVREWRRLKRSPPYTAPAGVRESV